MFRATSASSRALRFCIVGLATITAASVLTAQSADARRHHRHSRHSARVSSYSPPFSSIIVDANSGAVLQANNPDASRHPASLTKIMTLYLLFERLESGKMTLDSEMQVSAHAAEQAPTKLGLRPGQSIRVEDAIKGLVTRSANDAAVVISEAIAGDEDDFAQMMTRKARALGMSRTTYKNASGLPDDDQVTTARDQATLGRAIQDRFPRYYRYFATNDFRFRGSVIRNHNHLLGSVEGVDGIKTGYTRASGFNLVTSMRRGNRHLVGVVLGGRSGGSRDATMRSLLAQNLDRGATRRTVAAITERSPADYKLAGTNTGDDAAEAVDTNSEGNTGEIAAAAAQIDEAARTPLPPARPAAAVSLYAAANPSTAMAAPPPTVAPAAAQTAKPAPAPMTSGVIAQSLPIIPGSAEPMTPVRVKTVQVKAGQTRIASATPAVAAPIATASIPAPTPAPQAPAAVAETSSSVVAKADPLPPQNPRYGTGQGILGTLPASALQQHATSMASAEPATRTAAPSSQLAPVAAHGAIKAIARSGWIIQVGALESESEAKQRLDAARGSAAGLLGRADPFTETVVAKNGKALYRARFAGLDKDGAEAACRKLKRSDISCITIKN